MQINYGNVSLLVQWPFDAMADSFYHDYFQLGLLFPMIKIYLNERK